MDQSDGWRFQFMIFLLNEKKCIQTRLIITIIQLALIIALFEIGIFSAQFCTSIAYTLRRPIHYIL